MINWARYEEAKRLRNSGMIYKDVGNALGVSATRARQMIEQYDKHLKRLEQIAEDKKQNPIDFYRDLGWKIGDELRKVGIKSVEDARVLCGDRLDVYRNDIALPGWSETFSAAEWKASNKGISIVTVNKARELMGFKPLKISHIAIAVV